MLKKITNEEIYFIGRQLSTVFENSNQYLPAKINFYIQKNKNKIMSIIQEIEQTRNEIVFNFGEPSSEEDKYYIPEEKRNEFQKELSDLFEITQEVDINMISINDIENLHFTLPQMEALMFMIEE